jgi:histidine ammonia-lyase
LSQAADYLAIAISELASISERRIERLVNHSLSGPRLRPDADGKGAFG